MKKDEKTEKKDKKLDWITPEISELDVLTETSATIAGLGEDGGIYS